MPSQFEAVDRTAARSALGHPPQPNRGQLRGCDPGAPEGKNTKATTRIRFRGSTWPSGDAAISWIP
ncbi:MAG: hypothetical protein CBC35_07545 [Planctomycetes bacterium TMED75]|nr:hypothetical protein [Planctomycetaceae bacterium]OUU92210.1 MAG: hypothetical protein CBC35_07545 [Planctomycetes bacterium TMED75]